MTHLTRANVPSDDDNMSALTVSMKWQTSVVEAVKLMLGYGSNKSLNNKCAKWLDQLFLKKGKTHLQELQKWMQKYCTLNMRPIRCLKTITLQFLLRVMCVWDVQFMITVNRMSLSDVKRYCVVSLWYKRMNKQAFLNPMTYNKV